MNFSGVSIIQQTLFAIGSLRTVLISIFTALTSLGSCLV